MTAEQLVQEVRGGDMDSLGALMLRWERALYRFVYRMVPQSDDARDICQETFLRIYDKADRFREGSRFSTWMYQIALNLCRDQARKKNRWSKIVVADDVDEETGSSSVNRAAGDDDPAWDAELGERVAALNAAMDRLPPDQREVLVLKEFEGLKFKEIAGVVGCPESTVKSRMYYGLRALRQQLESRGFQA